MRELQICCRLAAGLIVACASLLFIPSSQRGSATAQSATDKKWCIGCSVDGETTPRTADGHPDLSGFWGGGGEHNFVKKPDGSVEFGISPPKTSGGGQSNPEQAPRRPAPNGPSYKPEYLAKAKAITASLYVDNITTVGHTTALDPQFDCKPLGVPRSSLNLAQIVQTPQLIAILYDPQNVSPSYRAIYMDGRPHPQDLDSSFLGDSIGHWEGDTLVVDVVGLSDETWLGEGTVGDGYASIHSDQEHVTERYTRNGDVLTYEATVEDPVVLTKPWVIRPRHIRHGGPEDFMLDSFCEAHNEAAHIIKPTK